MQLIKILNANYLIGICCDKGMNAGLWKHCLDEYDRKNYVYYSPSSLRVFPDGSDGKESTCNVGDLGSIPRFGRSPEGGHSNPF